MIISFQEINASFKKWCIPLALTPLGLIVPFAPRSCQLLLFLIGIAGAVHIFRTRNALPELRTPETLSLIGFLIYVSASYFWSENQQATLDTTSRLIMISAFTLLAANLLNSLSQRQFAQIQKLLLPALIFGVVSGACYGLLYYTENYFQTIFSYLGLSERKAIFSASNRLDLSKSLVLVNLAFFSISPWLWAKSTKLWMVSYIALLMACSYSDSQSALVSGLMGGSVLLIMKLFKNRAMRPLLVVFWFSFIAILPIIMSGIPTKLKALPFYQQLNTKTSSDIRLSAYSGFSEHVIRKPLFGYGLSSGVQYEGTHLSQHLQNIPLASKLPHNIHLQILFDIGFIGAFSFLLSVSLIFLKLEKKMGVDQLPFMMAVFFAGVGSSLFNLIIWASWFLSAFSVALIIAFIFTKQTHQEHSIIHS